MRIVLGTDESTALTDALAAAAAVRGADLHVLADGVPWPEVGRIVGEAVAAGEADLGIVCCWTGTGVSIAANKVQGVRAALCTDAATAAGARRWNDANVLALSLRLITPTLAVELLDAFLDTGPDPDEAPQVGRLEAPGGERSVTPG